MPDSPSPALHHNQTVEFNYKLHFWLEFWQHSGQGKRNQSQLTDPIFNGRSILKEKSNFQDYCVTQPCIAGFSRLNGFVFLRWWRNVSQAWKVSGTFSFVWFRTFSRVTFFFLIVRKRRKKKGGARQTMIFLKKDKFQNFDSNLMNMTQCRT